MTLSNAEKVRVGFFIVAGIVTFAACLIGLGIIKFSSERYTSYNVLCQQSISGLEKGAPVKYQGLTVGYVQDIGIAAQDSQAIAITLHVKASVPLTEGTHASLDYWGISGSRYINLVPGSNSAQLLAPGAQIPNKPDTLGQLSESASSVVHDSAQVVAQLTRWTDESMRARAERILTHMESISQELDSFIKEHKQPAGRIIHKTDTTLAALESATTDFKAHFSKGIESIGRAEKSLVTLAQSVQARVEHIDSKALGATLDNLRAISATLKTDMADHKVAAAFENFSRASSQLQQFTEHLDSLLQSGRTDVRVGLANLREASRELREFSRTIALNPSAILRGQTEQAR